jgi:hypothetical protein
MLQHMMGLGLFLTFCAGAIVGLWIVFETLRDVLVELARACAGLARSAWNARADLRWRPWVYGSAVAIVAVVLAIGWILPQRPDISNYVAWRSPECEGVAAVCRGLRWGYETPAGEVAIECRFDTARSFSEGLAAVCVGDSWGYIDHDGRFVIPPRFRLAGEYRGGIAAVGLDDYTIGYIDPHGNLVSLSGGSRHA